VVFTAYVAYCMMQYATYAVKTTFAWTDKVSNEEVLQRANTSKNLLKIIVNRQIRFVGHIMRKSQLIGSARVDRDDRRQKS